MNTVTITASVYHAALSFAGLKDIRAYLNGVRVEPAPNGTGIIAIACDGHTLAVFHDAFGTCAEPVTLPRMKVGAGHRKEGMLLSFDSERVTLSDGANFPAPFVSEDCGRYPDWRAVVPAPVNVADRFPAFIDTAYIARLEAMRDAYGVRWCAARFAYQDADRSVLVTFGENVPAFAVLMPVREKTERGSFELPEFMRCPVAARVAEIAASVCELEPETVYPEPA